MFRSTRFDFCGRIELDQARDAAPAPGRVPARKTDEGYLLADALLARDGLLEYSDGRSTWLEYRPRSELIAAADSWATTPITNEHPDRLVDADTWSAVAKGVHLGSPRVVDLDGTAYLQAQILITDRALVERVESGDRELSIGFTAMVRPSADGKAEDGTRCDAVQTQLAGNHTAVVKRGRAGPACRVLLDGSAWAVEKSRPEVITMTNEIKSADDDVERVDTIAPAPAVAPVDSMGTPADMGEYVLPDGSAVMLPTVVLAMLAELEQIRAQQGMESPMKNEPEKAAAPEDQMGAVEEEPKIESEGEAPAFEQEKKESASVMSERAREIVAREIGQRMPWVKLDGRSDDELIVLLDAAESMPKNLERDPWEGVTKKENAEPKRDRLDDAISKFLTRRGCEG